MADQTVVNQPTSRRKETEQFVRDLDPIQVAGIGTHSLRLTHRLPHVDYSSFTACMVNECNCCIQQSLGSFVGV